MLGLVDLPGFVDQQHGDAVVDPVGAAQTLVVQRVVTSEQERALVLGAGQDRQQSFV